MALFRNQIRLLFLYKWHCIYDLLSKLKKSPGSFREINYWREYSFSEPQEPQLFKSSLWTCLLLSLQKLRSHFPFSSCFCRQGFMLMSAWVSRLFSVKITCISSIANLPFPQLQLCMSWFIQILIGRYNSSEQLVLNQEKEPQNKLWVYFHLETNKTCNLLIGVCSCLFVWV